MSSQAQATTSYIPANTTFDGGPEGWVQNTTLSDCAKGPSARKDNCLTTRHEPIGGSSDGFLRNNTRASANDATDIYGISTATWDSPSISLGITNNELISKAGFKISLRAETIRFPGTVMATVANPFAAFRITLLDRTLNKIVAFRYENTNYASLPYDAIGSWQDYEWDLNDAERTGLISGHEYFLRVSAITTVFYQSMLTYDVHADFDNAKVVITSSSTPPPTTTTTPPPPPTDTTPTTPPPPPDDKREKPLPPTDQLGGSGDQFIEEPAGVPFDLSLKQCRIVNAYGAMQTITLPKKKAKVRIRRAASTMVTPTRNYSVWVQRKGKTKKKQIRRITYKVNNRQVKTDKRGRAIIGLKDLTPQTARKHRLSIRITQRRGKPKTINLTLTTKPCTVLMQASFERAQLKLRVADWYPLRKVRFSLPKGMNVKKVKRKVNSAVKVKIGKTTYRLTSLGKGNYKAISKTLPNLRLKAKGRTVTLTGLPANTRDISLIFKRSQKIVRASWLTKKKRAETLLFKAYVTDTVATRRTDYRAYNTKKRARTHK